MHGLVLAAGLGSRLAFAGTPKPFVEVGNRPLLAGVLGALEEIGCETITCLTRVELAAAARSLVAARSSARARVLACRTPSSLHTLALGLRVVPPGPVLCTMVDTVMPRSDWRAVQARIARDLERGADAVLVVTPFVDDERPVYVRTGPDGRVVFTGDSPVVPLRVTGGVYGFGERARRVCHEVLAEGTSRVRALLGAMVDRGLVVTAVEVPRIVDVDRPSDVEVANRWIQYAGSRP